MHKTLDRRGFLKAGTAAAAGIATVALTAVLARMWLRDAVSAVAAAAFVATMEYHIIYSRLVLSDGLFLFTFVTAVLLFTKAHDRGCWWTYVLAGVVTGICWNTKYHGFVPLVVYVLFLVLRLLRRTDSSGRGWGEIWGAALAAGIASRGKQASRWGWVGIGPNHRTPTLSRRAIGRGASRSPFCFQRGQPGRSSRRRNGKVCSSL